MTDAEKIKQLREALVQAKQSIKTWHDMPMIAGSQKGDPGVWDIYDRNSPEMKKINAALAASE